MKFFIILLLIKISECEVDRRIITTLKYSRYHTVPTIVHGYPALRGQMPYMVSIKEPGILRGNSTLWLPLCGASIISTKKVLTAAHCFEGRQFFYKKRPEFLRLVAGNLQSDILHSGETETTDHAQWRKIEKVYLHKDFAFPQNDIALIKIDEPWTFTDHVNYAVVASINGDYGPYCFSAGFGMTSYRVSPSLTPVLLQAKIEVMPLWKCTAVWEMDMSTFICTDSAISDVGQGDSGGPLGCRYTSDPHEEPGRDVLVGVVSGKNFDKTSLFTRVSRYKDWIEHPTDMVDSSDNKSCIRVSVCVVVCEHCEGPVDRQQCAVMEGFSYHKKCRKCYVCSETDLHGAEVFRGVIFCSSCSQRIFQGCSTARKIKDTATRNRHKSHRRHSHRSKEKARSGHPNGILAMTGLIASSDTSKSCSDAAKGLHKASKSLVISAKVALTVPKPTYNEGKSIMKNSTEVGMTTEVTQQLLKELNCPVVTRCPQKQSSPMIPTRSSHQKKSPCSDLRIAELGTSREIANMALRHKNELPVIIKDASCAEHLTSTSESVINKESDPADRYEECLDSAYSTLDDSTKAVWMDRRFQSILRIPYFAFKRNILNRSSLISDIITHRKSVCILKKIKRAFRHECNHHQKRGLKRLYSTINRRKIPNKLGWLTLVTNAYCTCDHSSNDVRCKHFHASHSYRCMRAQAMKLAGPTKSELAILRRRIKNLLAPSFVRNMAITYSKHPANMTSHACGTSKAASRCGNNDNDTPL